MTDSKREEYIDLAIRTEAPITPELVERMTGHARSIHAIFGLITETGELTDGFKRAIFYGKPLDITNVREELGDLFWYVAILMDVYGFSFEEVMRLNIQKLMARFPQKFTEVDALNRNLMNERSVLEGESFFDGVKVLDKILEETNKQVDPLTQAQSIFEKAIAEIDDLGVEVWLVDEENQNVAPKINVTDRVGFENVFEFTLRNESDLQETNKPVEYPNDHPQTLEGGLYDPQVVP